MYKETVKFFVNAQTKDAYPVLKGGKEESAREWSRSNRRSPINSRASVAIPGIEVETENLFHKVQVISTESRSQGGKLFKCKLFYMNNSVEDFVILDLRNEALFSIIQKGEFLGNGLFKGTYAIQSYSGNYYVSNLAVEESEFTKEYNDYLELMKRTENGEELSNDLGLNDLTAGHVYSKVSKGVIEKRKYLFMGVINVRKIDTVSSKPTPIFFNLEKFEYWFWKFIRVTGRPEDMTALSEFFASLSQSGYVLESVLNGIKNYGIYVKTSSRFFEDVSSTNRINLGDMVGMVPFNTPWNTLSSLHQVLEHRETGEPLSNNLMYYAKNLNRLLQTRQRKLYADEMVLYPLENFKNAVNKDGYIRNIIRDIDAKNKIITDYLNDYARNESIKLKSIDLELKHDLERYNHINNSNMLPSGLEDTAIYYAVSDKMLADMVDNNNSLRETLKSFIS